MMSFVTIAGLILVSGISTLLGSVPVFFHRSIREKQRAFWESFGGGVMLSASIFSLFLPAWKLSHDLTPLMEGGIAGVIFIILSARVMKYFTADLSRRRAILFVFVMALHNIPEGLSVGFDVAALGWEEALPLCIAIFIQNIPEGFASCLSFVFAGFSLPVALGANAVTALIETLSALGGHLFAQSAHVDLPVLLSFAGATMMTVVTSEIAERKSRNEDFSNSGFALGLVLCALLDLFL